jgi:iron transport multicopper oxidase
VYDEGATKPAAAPLDGFDPFDDFTLQPQDGMELLADADYTVTLDLAMDNLGDGAS